MAAQTRPLHGIFTRVPPRYDLINRLFTWGMDRRWRLMAARACLAGGPRRVLDLCCGTGDLALALAGLAQGEIDLSGLDYSRPMLALARRKAEKQAAGRNLAFVYGDAAHLPYPDGYFDCVGIAFAFRNLTYRNPLAAKYLREAFRVIRPGGRFVIVESSQPESPVLRAIDHAYLRLCVAPFGGWLSGDRAAYRYLAESAARFYNADEVRGLLLGSGFSRVSFRRLFCGAAAIHVAIK